MTDRLDEYAQLTHEINRVLSDVRRLGHLDSALVAEPLQSAQRLLYQSQTAYYISLKRRTARLSPAKAVLLARECLRCAREALAGAASIATQRRED